MDSNQFNKKPLLVKGDRKSMTPVTYIANSDDWILFSKHMNIILYNELQATTSPVEKPFLKKDIFDLGPDEGLLLEIKENPHINKQNMQGGFEMNKGKNQAIR